MRSDRRLLGSFLCALALLAAPSFTVAKEDFVKGVTISCQTSGWEWATPEMAKTLDELKSLGVNSFSIHPYAQIENDGHVRFHADSDHREITVPLDWARERGMSVMLIPHIAYWGSKFLWRGEINFQTTAEWDRFFGDYETWIVEMAKLAEAHGAGTFCVGLEFTEAQKFEARWRQIIAAVRARLSRQGHLRRKLGQLRPGEILGCARLRWRARLFPPNEKPGSVRGRNPLRLGRSRSAARGLFRGA